MLASLRNIRLSGIYFYARIYSHDIAYVYAHTHTRVHTHTHTHTQTCTRTHTHTHTHTRTHTHTHTHHVHGSDVKYVRIVSLLLKAGASTKMRGRVRETTPLHQACKKGNLAIVELLLQAKADVHAWDSMGFTPVHVACNRNHLDVAILLLLAGADLRRRDDAARTPLDVCRHNYGLNEETAAALRAYVLPRDDALATLRFIAEATGLDPDLANIVVSDGLAPQAQHKGLANEYRKNRQDGLYITPEEEEGEGKRIEGGEGEEEGEDDVHDDLSVSCATCKREAWEFLWNKIEALKPVVEAKVKIPKKERGDCTELIQKLERLMKKMREVQEMMWGVIEQEEEGGRESEGGDRKRGRSN
jgi:hypothetical protein